MYGGKTNNYEYVKIKGLKNLIFFNELLSLLKKGNSLLKPNQKWYKSLSKSNITIKDEIYILSVFLLYIISSICFSLFIRSYGVVEME
jgi:hypothetical protein